MKSNLELFKDAFQKLSGNWFMGFIVAFIALLLPNFVQVIPLLGLLIALVITAPLQTGMYKFYLEVAKGNQPSVNVVFDLFKNGFKNTLVAYFTLIAYIFLALIPLGIFIYVLESKGFFNGFQFPLQTLSNEENVQMMLHNFQVFSENTNYVILFFVCCLPMFVVALMYSQTFFILAENPEMNGTDALRKSKDLMHGNLLRYLGLGLALSCVLFVVAMVTFMFGFFFLIPWLLIVVTLFYLELKKKDEEFNTSNSSETTFIERN